MQDTGPKAKAVSARPAGWSMWLSRRSSAGCSRASDAPPETIAVAIRITTPPRSPSNSGAVVIFGQRPVARDVVARQDHLFAVADEDTGAGVCRRQTVADDMIVGDPRAFDQRQRDAALRDLGGQRLHQLGKEVAQVVLNAVAADFKIADQVRRPDQFARCDHFGQEFGQRGNRRLGGRQGRGRRQGMEQEADP